MSKSRFDPGDVNIVDDVPGLIGDEWRIEIQDRRGFLRLVQKNEWHCGSDQNQIEVRRENVPRLIVSLAKGIGKRVLLLDEDEEVCPQYDEPAKTPVVPFHRPAVEIRVIFANQEDTNE